MPGGHFPTADPTGWGDAQEHKGVIQVTEEASSLQTPSPVQPSPPAGGSAPGKLLPSTRCLGESWWHQPHCWQLTPSQGQGTDFWALLAIRKCSQRPQLCEFIIFKQLRFIYLQIHFALSGNS